MLQAIIQNHDPLGKFLDAYFELRKLRKSLDIWALVGYNSCIRILNYPWLHSPHYASLRVTDPHLLADALVVSCPR